ncbi:hypothetical protein AB0H88_22220 [Nonomuraea sp. NPDC050680]
MTGELDGCRQADRPATDDKNLNIDLMHVVSVVYLIIAVNAGITG